MFLDAIIFDLGGTLAYHRKAVEELIGQGHQSMTKYLKSRGLDVELDRVIEVSDEIYDAYEVFAEKSFIELDSNRIYPALLYQLGAAKYYKKDLISGAIKAFYGPIVDDYCLFEGAKQVLERLRRRNLKIGLVSNNHSKDFHSRLLKKHDLKKCFDSIVVSSMIGVRKPHRLIFWHCLAQLRVKPKDAVFVGDHSIHDIQGARNAGMRCIWIKRKEWRDIPVQPDWTAKSLSEAEEIIDNLIL